MGLESDQLEVLLSHQQLPPLRTSAGAGAGDDDDGCATPTAAASVLPAPSACPPAPRKPRPAARASATKRTKRLCCCHRGRRYWIVAVPRDLDLAAVFATRPPSSSAGGEVSLTCWSPASGKKIRVHVVG